MGAGAALPWESLWEPPTHQLPQAPTSAHKRYLGKAPASIPAGALVLLAEKALVPGVSAILNRN